MMPLEKEPGPVKLGFVEDVPTLQRLLRAQVEATEFYLQRLKNCRRQKNLLMDTIVTMRETQSTAVSNVEVITMMQSRKR